MKHFPLVLITFVSIIVFLRCMVFILSYLLSFLQHTLLRSKNTLIKHTIKSRYQKYILLWPSSLISFYNIQAMSQHLCNKQNVNILKHIYTYLISLRFTMTYKISHNLVQKVITYIQDRVLKVLTQLIFCWIFFLILQEQLSLQCSWSEDLIQMIFPFTFQEMPWNINFHQIYGPRTRLNSASV